MKILKIASIGTKTTLRKILLSSAIVVLFAAFNASAQTVSKVDETLVSADMTAQQASDLIASATPVAVAEYKTSKVTLYKVKDYKTSIKDEDEFAVFLSKDFKTLTDVSGFEVCSSFCKAPDGSLGATITTAKSAAACPITTACPSGFTSIDVDIHSHPAGDYKPSETDKVFLTREYSSRAKVSTLPELFSPHDKEATSGYLVTPTKLRHIKKGKIKNIYEF